MNKAIWSFVFLTLLPLELKADLQSGFFNPYRATGTPVDFESLSPVMRKWYVPQTLLYLYGWKTYDYTNYARDNYQRYVNLFLEGDRYYDLYGNYITRGWRIYDWHQEHPLDFGSSIFKNPRFNSWFNRVLISSASKGQFYTALRVIFKSCG